jgi:hypothetical protein
MEQRLREKVENQTKDISEFLKEMGIKKGRIWKSIQSFELLIDTKV